MPPKPKPKPRAKPKKPARLEREEAIELLEDIARNSGNAAARIAAIKQLEAMRDGEQPPAEGFAALD